MRALTSVVFNPASLIDVTYSICFSTLHREQKRFGIAASPFPGYLPQTNSRLHGQVRRYIEHILIKRYNRFTDTNYTFTTSTLAKIFAENWIRSFPRREISA